MPNANEPLLILVVHDWSEPEGDPQDKSDWDDLRAAYIGWSRIGVEALLKRRLASLPDGDLASQFRVDAFPSNVPIPSGLPFEITEAQFYRTLVFGIVMTGGPRAAMALANNLYDAFGKDASLGADLPVDAAQSGGRFWSHWCPGEAAYGLFGDRAVALRMIRAEPAQLPASLPGEQRVKIVFVDTGLPLNLLPAAGFRGWNVKVDPSNSLSPLRVPGDPLTPHGEMVARNALAVARPAPNPRLQLLDCPAIPDGIMNLRVFLRSVAAALHSVAITIGLWQLLHPDLTEKRAGWVLCNAWGVFDPSLEFPQIPYSDNPLHPVALALGLLEGLGVDIIFAAGNCGQFCPNIRCHPDYTGPGRSINGANALDTVLTVGAVRTDKLWLGYSGHGPGITGLAPEKPDLCAPSQFTNEDDAGPNTGTSAACGLAAGAVALLRTRWRHAVVDPATLRTALRNRAVQPYGPAVWQDRTGYGILDVAAADDWLNTHP